MVKQPLPTKASSVEQAVEKVLTDKFTCSNMNCNQGHLMEVDDDGNYSDYGMCRCMEAILEVKQQLLSLIAEERLDELSHVFVLEEPYTDISGKHPNVISVKERKAELQAQIERSNHE